MSQYEALLKRVKVAAGTGIGTLTPEEIQTVIANLETATDSADRVTLINILGYVGDFSARPVLERFLRGPDPAGVYAALKVLCRTWEFTADYIPELCYLLDRLVYPPRHLTIAPLQIAEDYLHRHQEPRLLRKILTLIEEPATDAVTRDYLSDGLINLTAAPTQTPEEAIRLARERLLREEQSTSSRPDIPQSPPHS